MPASRAPIDRYKRQIAIYRNRTAGFLVATWDGLGTYSEEDIDRFTQRTASVLAGAKTAAVGLSAAFYALSTRTRPVPVNVAEVAVEPRYRDPFLAAWHAVGEGRPWEEAFQAGRSMAQAVGYNLVQSSARRTGDVAAAKAGRPGRWQRVPGGKACSWCLLVAGQTYASAESADFGHDRCDCDAVPV